MTDARSSMESNSSRSSGSDDGFPDSRIFSIVVIAKCPNNPGTSKTRLITVTTNDTTTTSDRAANITAVDACNLAKAMLMDTILAVSTQLSTHRTVVTDRVILYAPPTLRSKTYFQELLVQLQPQYEAAYADTIDDNNALKNLMDVWTLLPILDGCTDDIASCNTIAAADSTAATNDVRGSHASPTSGAATANADSTATTTKEETAKLKQSNLTAILQNTCLRIYRRQIQLLQLSISKRTTLNTNHTAATTPTTNTSYTNNSILLMGMDTPELPMGELNALLQSNASTHYYICPCEDGGYGILHIPIQQQQQNVPPTQQQQQQQERILQQIFRNVQWSTSLTALSQLKAITDTIHSRSNSSNVLIGPIMYDIDTVHDLRNLHVRYQQLSAKTVATKNIDDETIATTVLSQPSSLYSEERVADGNETKATVYYSQCEHTYREIQRSQLFS